MQGNPFQPDVNYRGYTASPLLGTPQGLSVYMDGVRLNQPFGDVVSWDLIPRMAISSTITLMPGSNPLFGLNTLGGALSIQTKDGRSQPGTTVQVTRQPRRRAVEFEHGGVECQGIELVSRGQSVLRGGLARRFAIERPPVFRQARLAATPGRLSGSRMAYANNSLTGNGLQEQRFLDRDYASVYTKPDTPATAPHSSIFTARHSVRGNLTFSGNVYYRYIRDGHVQRRHQ